MTLAVRVLYVCVIMQDANKELVATLQYRVSENKCGLINDEVGFDLLSD